MNLDTLDQALSSMGTDPVPEPRAEFVLALEERLAAGPACELVAGPVRRAASRPRCAPLSPSRPAWAVLAAAAAVMIGLTVAQPAGVVHELRVATAVDAVMVLPDGTVGEAGPGVVVPDGTRILTGDEGHVTAGEVELGPNREGIVTGGVLDPDPAPTLAAPPTIPPVSAPSPVVVPPASAVPAPPTTTPAPAGESPGTPPGPRNPRPEPAATPPPSDPADPGPAVAVARPEDPGTKSPDEPGKPKPSRPAAAVLKLEANWRGDQVLVRWSRYEGKDFAAYVILRADAPAEPGYPVDGHTTVAGRLEDPAVVGHSETISDPGSRSYRVVALDHERRVVAVSPSVRPAADGKSSVTPR